MVFRLEENEITVILSQMEEVRQTEENEEFTEEEEELEKEIRQTNNV